MPKLLRVSFTGLFISFLGTLPLGTLNIASMQIAVTDGIGQAMYFALGVLLVEIIYVRISLVAMDWVRKQKRLFRILEWVTLMIIVALAIASFVAAASPGERKNIILSNNVHRFVLGVMMSAVNPMQIPFWFGWSTVLLNKGILMAANTNYNFYVAGIGIGTIAGFMVFIFGGNYLISAIKDKQYIMNWVIGRVLLVTAIIQLYKTLRKPALFRAVE